MHFHFSHKLISRKTHLFYKLIISYAIVLFLPIAIGSIYYLHSFHSISNQKSTNQLLLMENINERANILFYENSRINSYLAMDNRVVALSHDRNTYGSSRLLDLFYLQNTLNSLKIANSLYDNIGLYFTESAYYINSSSSYSRSLYSFDTAGTLNQDDFAQIEQKLQHSTRILYTTDDKSFVTLINVLFTDSTGYPLSFSCLQIKKSTLSNYLSNAAFTEQGISMLLLSNQQLLLSSDNQNIDINTMIPPECFSKGYMQTKTGDIVIDILPLHFEDIYIALATPLRTYYASSINLFTYMLVSILLCIITGGIAIWYYSNKNYRPISSILSFIGIPVNNTVETNRDEYELIIRYLADSKNELHAQRLQLKNTYIQKLLSGTICYEQIPESERPFSLSDTSMCIVSLMPDSDDAFNDLDDSSSLLLFSIENIFQEFLMQQHFSQSHFCFYNDTLVVLLRINKTMADPLDTIENCVNLLKKQVESFFQFKLLAGISPVLSEEQISEGFLHSKMAIEYQKLFETRSIQRFDLLPHTQTIGALSLNTYEYFINLIVGKNETQINNYFNTLAKELKNVALTTYDAQGCYYFFYRSLAQLKLYCQSHYNLVLESLDDIDSVLVLESVSKMLEQVRQLSLTVCDELKQNNSVSHSTQKLAEVCRFIDQNYADLNMNLNYIADTLQISPSYLSRKFKERHQKSVIDYLYEVRIEKAVNLLDTTDLKISAIALMCGFQDSNAFIRIFKKQKGITPGKYKSNY